MFGKQDVPKVPEICGFFYTFPRVVSSASRSFNGHSFTNESPIHITNMIVLLNSKTIDAVTPGHLHLIAASPAAPSPPRYLAPCRSLMRVWRMNEWRMTSFWRLNETLLK